MSKPPLNKPSGRQPVPLALSEHISVEADSASGLEEKLNEHLAGYSPDFELCSIQLTNTGSRLATESTFEYWATYLIAWRLRR